MTVRTADERAVEAERILNAQSPVNIEARRDYYRGTGWTAYDPKAPGYTADEIRKEREIYGRQR